MKHIEMPFSEHDFARASAAWCNPDCADAVELENYERIANIVDDSAMWTTTTLAYLEIWAKKYPFGY